MNELVIVTVLLGNLSLTSYRSVPAQTDDSPLYTSTGEHVNSSGIAVSQDLLKSGRVHYGDVVYVEQYGFKIVNDTMNVRHKNSADLWVATRAEEKAVGNRKAKIWLVRRKL